MWDREVVQKLAEDVAAGRITKWEAVRQLQEHDGSGLTARGAVVLLERWDIRTGQYVPLVGKG